MNSWWIKAGWEEMVGRFSFSEMVMRRREMRIVAEKPKVSSGEL